MRNKKINEESISRNEVENDEHDVLVVSSETNTQRSELGGKMNKKKRNLFFFCCSLYVYIYIYMYIKFDVGIETGKDKENNLIEVISQGINFIIILDKISPLYNVIYKGSSVVMLLL